MDHYIVARISSLGTSQMNSRSPTQCRRANNYLRQARDAPDAPDFMYERYGEWLILLSQLIKQTKHKFEVSLQLIPGDVDAWRRVTLVGDLCAGYTAIGCVFLVRELRATYSEF